MQNIKRVENKCSSEGERLCYISFTRFFLTLSPSACPYPLQSFGLWFERRFVCWQWTNVPSSLQYSLPEWHCPKNLHTFSDNTRKGMAQSQDTFDFSPHRDYQLNAQKIPSLVERGDWHKYVVLYYSAVFSSATTSASTAGVSATSAAGAASAAFLERRVRLAFFSVFAIFSL